MVNVKFNINDERRNIIQTFLLCACEIMVALTKPIAGNLTLTYWVFTRFHTLFVFRPSIFWQRINIYTLLVCMTVQCAFFEITYIRRIEWKKINEYTFVCSHIRKNCWAYKDLLFRSVSTEIYLSNRASNQWVIGRLICFNKLINVILL